MSLKRRVFTKEFKQQIIREVQAGKSIAQASREHDLHPNLIAKWQKLHEQYAQNAFQGNGHAYTQESKIAELVRLLLTNGAIVNLANGERRLSAEAGRHFLPALRIEADLPGKCFPLAVVINCHCRLG